MQGCRLCLPAALPTSSVLLNTLQRMWDTGHCRVVESSASIVVWMGTLVVTPSVDWTQKPSTPSSRSLRRPPASSQCKTRCFLACWFEGLLEVALPGGEVVRKVDGSPSAVFSCGGVVVSQGKDGVSVYDKDLTLLRSISREQCRDAAVSPCGGWVITSSWEKRNARLWDVNTGEAVACLPAEGSCRVALSRCASIFAVVGGNTVQLYDWSGAALRSGDVGGGVLDMQFTPCGKYLVVRVQEYDEDRVGYYDIPLRQYDVATMSCVREIPQCDAFAISPCSRVVMIMQQDSVIVTRHLYPHNSE